MNFSVHAIVEKIAGVNAPEGLCTKCPGPGLRTEIATPGEQRHTTENILSINSLATVISLGIFFKKISCIYNIHMSHFS